LCVAKLVEIKRFFPVVLTQGRQFIACQSFNGKYFDIQELSAAYTFVQAIKFSEHITLSKMLYVLLFLLAQTK